VSRRSVAAAAIASNRKKFMIRVLPQNELNELSETAETDGLTLSDLLPICERFSVAPKDVLNELSIVVAEGYLDGSLTYEFCDGVMNGIINAVVEVSVTDDMPQPAFSLYQAFDQGEWFRSDDPPVTDTGGKYTKPVVVEIMRTLKD
jgi:DNA-binding Xre family transcriptional regulator